MIGPSAGHPRYVPESDAIGLGGPLPLYRKVASLAEDGQASGFAAPRAFKSRHFVVSVNCRHPDGMEATSALADRHLDLITHAWTQWHRRRGVPHPDAPSLRAIAGGCTIPELA
jgi:hypothetical protein